MWVAGILVRNLKILIKMIRGRREESCFDGCHKCGLSGREKGSMHELYSMLEAFHGVDTCYDVEALLLLALLFGFKSVSVWVPDAIAMSCSL